MHCSCEDKAEEFGGAITVWCFRGFEGLQIWKEKKNHLSSLMQAEWMCLEIRVLLSHGGVFDFKPIFSWSSYFIKSISVHYIKSPLYCWEEKALHQKPHMELRESKPLPGIGVYTFMNQINKCYQQSCCSCQTKCIIAVILLPSESFTLSVQILHTVFHDCIGSASAPGFLSVSD